MYIAERVYSLLCVNFGLKGILERWLPRIGDAVTRVLNCTSIEPGHSSPGPGRPQVVIGHSLEL